MTQRLSNAKEAANKPVGLQSHEDLAKKLQVVNVFLPAFDGDMNYLMQFLLDLRCLLLEMIRFSWQYYYVLWFLIFPHSYFFENEVIYKEDIF